MSRGEKLEWERRNRLDRLKLPGESDRFRRVTVPQRRLIRQLERDLGEPSRDLTGVSLAAASEIIDGLIRAKEQLDPERCPL